jgi:predicted metal-dependent hydrolase
MEPESIKYKVSYRNVKYPRLEFKTGDLLLIVPFGHDAKALSEKHREWIVKKNEFIDECLQRSSDKEIVDRTDEKFKELISLVVRSTSKELDVTVNKIYFRKMRTKWASCSPKRNLTINTLMRHLPKELIEYVVFHEITHLIEKRHSEHFWNIISRRFDSYKDLEKDLFGYWFLIQRV